MEELSCLFIESGNKRKWWRHEWLAVVGAAFMSFGYSLGRGEDGVATSVSKSKGRRRSKRSSTHGRWRLEACMRTVAVAALP
jgi:hypothetical protein